jgi:STE24 endopeptidase
MSPGFTFYLMRKAPLALLDLKYLTGFTYFLFYYNFTQDKQPLLIHIVDFSLLSKEIFMLNAVGITFLVLVLLNFFLEAFLTFLNLGHLKQTAGSLPPVFQKYIDSETHKKTMRYNLDAGKFSFLEMVVSLLVIICFVYWGGFDWIDRIARSNNPNGYYLPALVFGVMFFLIKTVINLPFDLYGTFVIEERYGFNKMTPRLFVSDLIKALILNALIGIPIYLGILWFIAKAGIFWWIWCWGFLMMIQILMLIIYPIWIAPLFNKFTPLEDGELKDAILSLTKKAGFPFQGLFMMDGSKRSKHSNAFFTGIGNKKRIVLFDTLIGQMKIPQILSVLAHEIGHYKLHHVKKLFVVSSLGSLLSLYLLSRLFDLEIFYQGFGFSHPSTYAALVILSLSLSSLSFLFTPLFSALSRRFEYKADEFAIKNLDDPRPMTEVIAVLAKENLSTLNPHPWYSFFHYSHPSPVERVKAMEKIIGT